MTITKHFAVVIANEYYGNLRKEDKKWADVKQAPQDVQDFKHLLKSRFSINESDIIELHNAKRAQLFKVMEHLTKLAKEAGASKYIKLCIWIYYAGHGVMDNMNFIVLNEKSNLKRYFALEDKINKLTEVS